MFDPFPRPGAGLLGEAVVCPGWLVYNQTRLYLLPPLSGLGSWGLCSFLAETAVSGGSFYQQAAAKNLA